jgi:hypothetical protein
MKATLKLSPKQYVTNTSRSVKPATPADLSIGNEHFGLHLIQVCISSLTFSGFDSVILITVLTERGFTLCAWLFFLPCIILHILLAVGGNNFSPMV